MSCYEISPQILSTILLRFRNFRRHNRLLFGRRSDILYTQAQRPRLFEGGAGVGVVFLLSVFFLPAKAGLSSRHPEQFSGITSFVSP